MRIIAGDAKGRPLCAPKGQDTRPTQDYVKESLFNILRLRVPDAQVLDLFAGSGALALESLSRGAEAVVMADQSPEAIACIRRNLEQLGYQDRAAVIRGDWLSALRQLQGDGRKFTLVFLDPPYRITQTGEQCAKMAELGLLAEGALIVIEHRRGVDPAVGEGFTLCDSRRYGDTAVDFYEYGGGEAAHA